MRAIALSLMVVWGSGCSYLFAKGPPAAQATQQDYACTSHPLLPWADVAWGTLNLVWGTGRALVAPESFGDVGQAQVIVVTAGWAVVSALSARHGFLRVRACRRAQDAAMARLSAGMAVTP